MVTKSETTPEPDTSHADLATSAQGLPQPPAVPVATVKDPKGIQRVLPFQDTDWQPAQVSATDEQIAAATARLKAVKS